MSADELAVRLRVEGDCRGEIARETFIEQLSAAMADLVAPRREAEILASAREREQLAPTWIGLGMAVPHARIPSLTAAGVIAVRCPQGVVWTPEGDRANLIFFLTVPEESPELHLHLLSRLMRWRRSLKLTEQELLALPTEEWEAGLREALGTSASTAGSLCREPRPAAAPAEATAAAAAGA